jgi:uncharacterized protein YbbC (DUF1343 family)/CubicO group peptidase (beta-lactamase class C family)
MRILIALLFAGIPFAQQAGIPERASQVRKSPAAPKKTPRTGASVRKVPTSIVFTGGPALDALITDAIREDEIPGAVVLVGYKGRIVFQKAYGSRALKPRKERMTLDTIFDVASLTKVVATTSSIMKLVEEGKVRLNDRVIEYIPEYQGGKSDITVRQLLTHFSGLRPDVDLEPVWNGEETGIQLAIADLPLYPPNTRFIYSDINFVLLGEIVKRTSGKSLPEYAAQKIFRPLGMRETMFQPPARLKRRIAPTERVNGNPAPLRGVVHDPTTRFMGGVAGHAGLFSTAADLARFAQMMLNLGEYKGARIFSPLTVRAFTTPQTPADQPVQRGLGWDIDSPFSGNRGDLFPVGSYGHTGFTGTSMWIDPSTESYVIFLSNSVHPKLRPAITPLRAKVASVAAAGLPIEDLPAIVPAAPRPAAPRIQEPKPRNAEVLTGLDVLEKENFARLKGKRVGIISNHTGLNRDGKRNVDLMVAAGVNVRALYSPEHGFGGREDHEQIGHGTDAATGIPIWSLYSGENRRPTEEMLRDIDVLVFDIQDVGARFYTYICTMQNAMEQAARRNIQFMVLDRPNPITGTNVEGPLLEPALKSFIGCFVLPLRHGMTIGEIAQMMNAEMEPKANLEVVKMYNWLREDWFDSTGLTWVHPSPNMRSLTAALLYPGIGMLEGSKVYSVGRGTDAPFEQIGADWIDGRELAAYLNARAIPGVRVYPTRLKPTSSNFSGALIEGVRFVITDRYAFNSSRFGLELGTALARLYPGKMTWEANARLVGNQSVLDQMAMGIDAGLIERSFAPDVQEFMQKRARFLLY